MLSRDQILQLLRQLKPSLQEKYQISDIGLFGSLARGQNEITSDIDIVVKMPADLLKRIRLKRELEAKFNCEVDVIRYWEGMNQYLKTEIERDAVYA